MMWTVRILKAVDTLGRTVFDVIATNNKPVPWENPDLLVASYPDRLNALVAARLFAERQGVGLHEAKVIPFPKARRAG